MSEYFIILIALVLLYYVAGSLRQKFKVKRRYLIARDILMVFVLILLILFSERTYTPTVDYIRFALTGVLVIYFLVKVYKDVQLTRNEKI